VNKVVYIRLHVSLPQIRFILVSKITSPTKYNATTIIIMMTTVKNTYHS